MLVERVSMGLDLDPLAAAGDRRRYRGLGNVIPRILLQLRHVLLRGPASSESDHEQHGFGFEHRAAFLDPPVESRPDPTEMSRIKRARH